MNKLPNEFFTIIIEHNSDAILVVDQGGEVFYANKAATEIFGRCRSDIVGQPFGFPISGSEPQLIEISRPNQLIKIVEMHVVEVRIQQNDYYLANFRVITDYHHHIALLTQQSLKDPLTNLYNRRGFMRLAEQTGMVASQNQRKLGLIYMDIDGLKEINDIHGHSAGDDAIQVVAQMLKDTFRESDILARIGGDEFVALLSECSTQSMLNVTTRLTENLNQINVEKIYPFMLSISWGIAQSSLENPMEITKLIEMADGEMYLKKQAFSPENK